jgi:phage FluMu protein gp41
MSTLEKLQAAAKAKLSAGQSLAATPVSNAPTAAVQTSPQPTATPTAAVKSPGATATPTVKAPTVTATVSPQIQQEIQRKAAAGIALTNPNAASTAAYKAAQPAVAQSPAVAVKTAAQPTTAPTVAANTNYVAQGGKTLNDILYLKDNYRTDNKNYISSQANPLYAQLDQQTAAMVKGMSADQLRNYINGLGNQKTATTQNEGLPEEAPVDYTALATAEYERQLAAMLAGAQSNEKELNRRYEYANGVTQDNRQLETASFYRNNAPTAWDGSTGYQAAQTDRNRSIEDHYTQEGLTDATAAAYAQANAFRDQSGNFISSKANELQTQAQQLAMQEAGLTGSYKGQQTMQGASSAASTAGQLISNQGQLISNQGQQIANQIAQINLDNYPAQVKLQLQQLQQQVNSGAISNQTAQYQLQQLTDPTSVTNQVAALDLQMKQIDASNYSENQKLQLEQLRKTVAEIGKVQPVSSYEQQMQSLDLQKAQLQLQQLQNPTTPTITAEEYATSYLDKSVQRDEDGAITNLNDVKAQILQSGLPDSDIAKLYLRYGIPLPQGYSGN